MNASDIFRQATAVPPRTTQSFFQPSSKPSTPTRRDNDGTSGRIAHTLTACCRCRQRKTRCDPTLPRCLPCERSGSICEYYDSTKGRRISRFYVVKLQEKVRQLEAELAQFTEEDLPQNTEDMIRPGGLVRLSDTDETPRYLGPSSGIAMTRLVMEQAKQYTDSQRISELIPELRARRMERLQRMQRLQATAGPSGSSGNANMSGSGSGIRKKSYPMISAHPAGQFPSRPLVDKLFEVFYARAQLIMPVLHERVFSQDIDEVLKGSTDPFKNFTVRMALAISLQMFDTHYAGLADSYYLSAMEHFEDVIRPKDLCTLQCLSLLGQYSLLTPTRTNIYHIIGLATRICQQLGIVDAKTIAGSGYTVDPMTLDMRRRIAWATVGSELGLAETMGRPNGFAKCNDIMDIGPFADVDDEHITESGIQPGPPSQRKRVALHFCKVSLLKAEIRRTLYEKKRPKPNSEDDPWFAQMEQKVRDWSDSAPSEPVWCRSMITSRYHAMIILLFRPSPQVPQPSATSALKCFMSSAEIIMLGNQQANTTTADITWTFLLSIYTSINALVWSVSYPEVRQEHGREEIEELVNTSLDIIDRCSERWPGASAASQLYAIFTKACLQSYDTINDATSSGAASPFAPTFNKAGQLPPDGLVPPSPSSQVDPTSPSMSDTSMPTTVSGQSGHQKHMQQQQQPLLLPQQHQQQQQRQPPIFFAPQFGGAANSSRPETVHADTFGFEEPFAPNQPQFRSGSIFLNPASTEPMGRRFSFFPPEAPPSMAGSDSMKDMSPIGPPMTGPPSSIATMSPMVPASPDMMMSMAGSSTIMSPVTTLTAASSPTPTPTVRHLSPTPVGIGIPATQLSYEPPGTPQNHQSQASQAPTFNIPHPFQAPCRVAVTSPPLQSPPSITTRQQQQPLPPTVQRPLPPPTTGVNWFSAPPPQHMPQQQQHPQHHHQPPPPAPNSFLSYTFGGINTTGAPSPHYLDGSATMSAFGLGAFGGMGALGGLAGMPGNHGGISGPAIMDGRVGLGHGMSLGGDLGSGSVAGGWMNGGAGGGVGGAAGGMLGDMPVLQDPFGAAMANGGHPNPERQGSLSQEQQMELMDALETEGMGEINTFLGMDMRLDGAAVGVQGNISWQ